MNAFLDTNSETLKSNKEHLIIIDPGLASNFA
jgi:hypothetical protein